jgi:protein-disulfide isomerase
MTLPNSVSSLAAVAAALLLTACGEKRMAVEAPTARTTGVATAPADLAALLPEAPIDALTDDGRAAVARFLDEEFCHCGCPHTVSSCLREHAECAHAKRMGWVAARLVAGGVPGADLRRTVTEYYASFENAKRSRLQLDGFGPPLGDEKAPIAIVEYSDFTCPYCQLLRTQLEKWVEARPGRVKLYYKPFPIPSHEHAMEAAQAGEWAREQGRFWPMHDTLFSNPGALSPDELAGYARELGLDGDDLLAALAEDRYGPKIRAAMLEARGAGLAGTPTLWFQGRRMTIADFSDEMLEHTLQDEEEWQKHRGWAKD